MLCCGSPKVDQDKFSSFSDACYSANLDKMKQHLLKNPRMIEKIVNEMGEDGYTPIHRAAQRGNVEVISFLLSQQADPCALSKNGETALHIAAFHRKRAAVREFLKTTLIDKIDLRDTHHGMSALHVAIYRGSPNIAELLLEAGADPNAKDNYGNNAIDLAEFWVGQAKAGLASPTARHQKTLEVLKQYVEDLDDVGSHTSENMEEFEDIPKVKNLLKPEVAH